MRRAARPEVSLHRDTGIPAESLSRSITVGYREGVAWSRDLLGVLAAARGDRAEAGTSLRESLRVHWALVDRWRTSSVLEALASVTADASDAARLLGAGAALRTEIGRRGPRWRRTPSRAPVPGWSVLSAPSRSRRRRHSAGSRTSRRS